MLRASPEHARPISHARRERVSRPPRLSSRRGQDDPRSLATDARFIADGGLKGRFLRAGIHFLPNTGPELESR